MVPPLSFNYFPFLISKGCGRHNGARLHVGEGDLPRSQHQELLQLFVIRAFTAPPFPSFEDLCASYHTPLPTYDSNFCCHLTLPTHPGPSCPAWLSPEGLLPSCIPVLHLTLLSHMLAHKPSSQLPPSQQGLAEKRDAESLRSPSHLRCCLLLEVESKAQGARPRGFPPDGKR